MSTLLLVDAHAMIHRAFHALPTSFTSSDGTPTNAIYGFFMMMQKVIGDFRPSHIAICFDTPKPTFRKELLPEYQSKRPPMDDALKKQIPIILEILQKAGIATFAKPGFEADDVIGTLATQFDTQADRILILTGDRDILQLAKPHINVIAPKKGVSEFTLFTPEYIQEKFGIIAAQIPDYKALAGDASDNYHAAQGIGPKTAVTLLTQFSSIETLFDRIEEVKNERWRSTLKLSKEKILLLKKIATIVRDVELHVTFEQLVFQEFSPDCQEILQKYQLFSVMNKLFPPQKSAPSQKAKIVKKESDPQDQPSLF